MMRKQRKTEQHYYLLTRKSRGKSSTGADTGGAPDMPGLTGSRRDRQTGYRPAEGGANVQEDTLSHCE
jgi:hypothetical protein